MAGRMPAGRMPAGRSVWVFVVVEADVGGDEVGEDGVVEELGKFGFVEDRLAEVEDRLVVFEEDREGWLDFEFVEVDGRVGAGGEEVFGREGDFDLVFVFCDFVGFHNYIITSLVFERESGRRPAGWLLGQSAG